MIRHSKTQTQTSKLSNEGKIKKYEKSICSFFDYQQSSIMSSKEEKKGFFTGQQLNAPFRAQLLQVISVHVSFCESTKITPTKNSTRTTPLSDSNTIHMRMQLQHHKHFYIHLKFHLD